MSREDELLKALIDISSKKIDSFDEFANEFMLAVSENGHKVPILSISVDLEKYNKEHKGSCEFCVIPDLQNDEHIQKTLFDLVDYIRENYDCNKFVEV